jgi:hypothetical protein
VARRLPVIQSDESEDAVAASRPRVHWIFIGAGLSVTIWAPLALVATPLGVRAAARAVAVSREDLASGAAHLSTHDVSIVAVVTAAPIVLSFFVGSLLAGVLVGRFGGKSGPREAVLGGVLGAVLVAHMGFRPGLGLSVAGIFAVFAMLSLFGAAGGGIGGLWGTRSRRKAVLDSKVT